MASLKGNKNGRWKGGITCSESVMSSRRRYPERAKARQKVYYAMRMGRIVRPTECAECGKTCKPEAHHEDYNKPLEVEWLCRKCHEPKHQQMRNEGRLNPKDINGKVLRREPIKKSTKPMPDITPESLVRGMRETILRNPHQIKNIGLSKANQLDYMCRLVGTLVEYADLQNDAILGLESMLGLGESN